jgi:hypothetical protein
MQMSMGKSTLCLFVWIVLFVMAGNRPSIAQTIDIVEAEITSLWIFNPQDRGQNARDEPFFIRYDGTRDLGDDCIRPPRVPENANRGPNTVDVPGRALQTLGFELWERDGDSYNCRFDEEDGTAGNDNRLGKVYFDSTRRIRVAHGERGSLNVWRTNFESGRTYYIPIRDSGYLYYVIATPKVTRVDLGNVSVQMMDQSPDAQETIRENGDDERTDTTDVEARDGSGLEVFLNDFQRQVEQESGISSTETQDANVEDPVEE